MVFEMLVGLEVTNDDIYQQYRDAMAPILDRFGGKFSFDAKVSQQLLGEGPVNRVFILQFGSEETRDQFFADADYMEVKGRFFTPSVGYAQILAEYEKRDS